MKIANKTWTEISDKYVIHLDTLGIINRCVDVQVQEPSYPQEALGVPVNYTNPDGNGPYYAFQATGDYPRSGLLEGPSYLIDSGIKVAMALR
jgi:hypothetical protein